MHNKATMNDLRAQIDTLSATMDDLSIARVMVSDHMTVVVIGYVNFVRMFGDRADCPRLGSQIRCVEDGITFCSEVEIK